MRFIGRVIACSIEASQAHVNSIRTILKSVAPGRNEAELRRADGGYLIVKALGTFFSVHNLVCAGSLDVVEMWTSECEF